MKRYQFQRNIPGSQPFMEPADNGAWVEYADASQSAERVRELTEVLQFFWDLADLNSWEIGVHHSSTDLLAQRLTYSCGGCDASVVRSAESNGVAMAAMNFPHGKDCMYVKLRDLAEARAALEGEKQ